MNALACVCIRQDESYLPECQTEVAKTNFHQSQVFANLSLSCVIVRKASQLTVKLHQANLHIHRRVAFCGRLLALFNALYRI